MILQKKQKDQYILRNRLRLLLNQVLESFEYWGNHKTVESILVENITLEKKYFQQEVGVLKRI